VNDNHRRAQAIVERCARKIEDGSVDHILAASCFADYFTNDEDFDVIEFYKACKLPKDFIEMAKVCLGNPRTMA
jgi:hypothetical protein